SQSLHSYLSTVFDVNWSVGQSNTEDSFVTAPSSSSSFSASGSPSSSRSSARRPTLGQRTIESFMEPEQDNASIARRHRDSRQEALQQKVTGTDSDYKADESHQLPQQQHQGNSRP